MIPIPVKKYKLANGYPCRVTGHDSRATTHKVIGEYQIPCGDWVKCRWDYHGWFDTNRKTQFDIVDYH